MSGCCNCMNRRIVPHENETIFTKSGQFLVQNLEMVPRNNPSTTSSCQGAITIRDLPVPQNAAHTMILRSLPFKIWAIFPDSRFSCGVRNTRPCRFPFPHSTEHSSLYITSSIAPPSNLCSKAKRICSLAYHTVIQDILRLLSFLCRCS